MQIALLRNTAAALFPGRQLHDILELRLILLHMFVAETEGRPLTVSKLARTLGMSRASVRRRLKELIEVGYVTFDGKVYALIERRDVPNLRNVLVRNAKIIMATAKEVAKLASSS